MSATRTLEAIYRERARHLAEKPLEARIERVDMLVFGLGDARYAVELSALAEVLPYRGATAVPGAPARLVGVINVRGDIRAIADPRADLGLPAHDRPETGYVLMLADQNQPIGLRVDSVEAIRQIDPRSVAPVVARHNAATGARPITGITPDSVIVLDAPALLETLAGSTDLEDLHA